MPTINTVLLWQATSRRPHPPPQKMLRPPGMERVVCHRTATVKHATHEPPDETRPPKTRTRLLRSDMSMLAAGSDPPPTPAELVIPAPPIVLIRLISPGLDEKYGSVEGTESVGPVDARLLGLSTGPSASASVAVELLFRPKASVDGGAGASSVGGTKADSAAYSFSTCCSRRHRVSTSSFCPCTCICDKLSCHETGVGGEGGGLELNALLIS